MANEGFSEPTKALMNEISTNTVLQPSGFSMNFPLHQPRIFRWIQENIKWALARTSLGRVKFELWLVQSVLGELFASKISLQNQRGDFEIEGRASNTNAFHNTFHKLDFKQLRADSGSRMKTLRSIGFNWILWSLQLLSICEITSIARATDEGCGDWSGFQSVSQFSIHHSRGRNLTRCCFWIQSLWGQRPCWS